MVIAQVTTSIGNYTSKNMVSVMHFSDLVTPLQAATRLNTLYNAVKTIFPPAVDFQVRPEGKFIDEVTGDTTGYWTIAPQALVAGTNAGQGTPDATQVLVRWRTGSIRANRRVIGRQFWPSPAVGNMAAGNLSSGAITTMNTALTAFIGANDSGLTVWSRPQDGQPGSKSDVLQGTVWDELSVLRRRRG